MKTYTILIIEDHPDIAKILKMGALAQGYKVLCAPNVLNAYELIRKQKIDLMILDWMLPGQNGLSFLKDLKAHHEYAAIPVVMLTCMSQEDHKIEGLEAGADDYVIKPFSSKELFLRIANILKKQNIIQHAQKQGHASENNYKMVDAKLEMTYTIYFSMDFKNKKIWAQALQNEQTNLALQPILLDLSPTEFKLLSIFIQYPEQLFSREQLLDLVWQGANDVQDRTIDVHIKRLRQNIKTQTQNDLHAQAIQTVRGFGYRLSNAD